jgi:phenylpropionate dioxygenase-like ring-hydroxylating dioxygenase large terminal subunit
MQGISSPLPLMQSKDLRKIPQKIFVFDKPFVVWRSSGKVFLMSAVCPHRGADLSFGKICDGHLECPYHGWQFEKDKEIYNPFEKKGKGQAEITELKEYFGFLWLNSNPSYFENLQKSKPSFLGTFNFIFPAPLHVTLDNFCDGAHLPFVHDRNGASRDMIDGTKFKWSEDEKSIEIEFDYEQRKWTLISLLNYFFTTRWFVKARIEFQPLTVQYTIYWYRPKSGKIINGSNQNMFFFYPGQANQTIVPCLVFQEFPFFLKPFQFILKYIVFHLTRHLIQEDIDLVGKIINFDKKFGSKLEKYDAPIVRVRQRLFEQTEFYNEK